MDVLESLNGMLIKDLGCGLRCKDHRQLQNVPLELSVISAQTRELYWPADAPLQHFNHRLVDLDFATCRRQKQFNFDKPAARLQNKTATLCQNITAPDTAKQRCEYKDKG